MIKLNYRRLFFIMLSIVVGNHALFSQHFDIDQLNIKISKRIDVTTVKDQYKSSTCWSFCVLSMLESELIEGRGEELDLSEMWIVRHAYVEKAIKYVRMHGVISFSPGGACNDVIDVIAKYGIVTEDAYPATKSKNDKIDHLEMDNELKEFINGLVAGKDLIHNPDWLIEYNKILDKYLGEIPETFNYNKGEFNPKSFAKYLGINPNDYILLGSYTHHPYYERFVLEVPDNWSWGKVLNLPMDEFEQIVDSSLSKGYSIAWAADVTENSFNWSQGIAYVPANQINSDTVRISYNSVMGIETSESKPKLAAGLFAEKEITVELRQFEFDNYLTTDDHGMHIIGTATDKFDTEYYLVKNSWGMENTEYKGFMFVTKNYMKLKTTSILINKKAIPSHLSKKLL